MLINFQLLQLNLSKLETSKVIPLVFLNFGIIMAILKNMRMIRSPLCNVLFISCFSCITVNIEWKYCTGKSRYTRIKKVDILVRNHPVTYYLVSSCSKCFWPYVLLHRYDSECKGASMASIGFLCSMTKQREYLGALLMSLISWNHR